MVVDWISSLEETCKNCSRTSKTEILYFKQLDLLYLKVVDKPGWKTSAHGR